ncbi:hypothetical protein CS542_05755 [Pedobacter sp. IW39]|nr:hypothetical protein CS542_05755 [Pedobacter sp. IW39]
MPTDPVDPSIAIFFKSYLSNNQAAIFLSIDRRNFIPAPNTFDHIGNKSFCKVRITSGCKILPSISQVNIFLACSTLLAIRFFRRL